MLNLILIFNMVIFRRLTLLNESWTKLAETSP